MHLLSRINRTAPVCLHRSIAVYKPASLFYSFFLSSLLSLSLVLSLLLSVSRSVTMVSNVPGRKIRRSVCTCIYDGRRERFSLTKMARSILNNRSCVPPGEYMRDWNCKWYRFSATFHSVLLVQYFFHAAGYSADSPREFLWMILFIYAISLQRIFHAYCRTFLRSFRIYRVSLSYIS